jgi:hypothetical protein
VYEEYGAKYELMIKDVASAYRTMPQWEAYQKGLEALASSLSSINLSAQHANSRKALTVGDLLVKVSFPILFCSRINSHSANPKSLQVSTSVCRTFKADTSLRLS